MPPERIQNYRILEEIGRGGFGVVYRARDDVKLKRDVAVKELLVERARDPRARKRFLVEARTMAQFSHPNVAVVYDVLAMRGGLFLIMELATGGTLRQRLERQHALPLAEVLELGRAATGAFAYLHAQGVVHCDVKPSNLLFTREGRLKVVDFGLARFLPGFPLDRDTSRGGGSGKVSGTLPYIPPERLRSQAATPRSDVFSLCVVLYEAAMGRRPFDGASLPEMALSVLRSTPGFEPSPPGSMTPALAAVLARGLAKDPAERYPDMLTLGADLERALAPPAAPHRSTALRSPRPGIVGRDAEIGRVSSLLGEIGGPGGRGQTLLVAGEAGIGKSVVAEEVVRLAVEGALPAAISYFREGRRGFRPIATALASIGARLLPDRADDVLAAMVALSKGEVAAAGAPPFPDLLDRAFEALASAGPFLVVLENLHEAGPDALAALRLAAVALPATQGLLLATYRSEDAGANRPEELGGYLLWARGERLAEEIVLGRLGRDDTALLVGRLLGLAESAPPELTRFVHAETEGNPLFVRETVRYLAGLGRIGPGGEIVPGTTRELPRLVRDVLQRRIAGLEPDLARTLEAAAVDGEVFHTEVLSTLLELKRDEVLRGLERLVRDHAIVLPHGGDYRFSHSKIREVVLERMLPEARADLHRRLADLLQRSSPRADGDIARHLVAGDRRDQAVPFLISAARRAGGQAATDEARSLFALAAEALAARGAGGRAELLEVLLELGRLQQLAGRRGEARESFETAARLALKAPHSRGVAVHNLGWIRLREGDLSGAKRSFSVAFACFAKAGDRVWMAACKDARGVAHRRAGALGAALRDAQSALAERRWLGFAWGVALSQSNLGSIYFTLGRARQALACFEASRRYFERHGSGFEVRQRLAVALGNIGTARERLGDLEGSLAAYTEALAIQRAIGDRHGEAMSLVNLGDTHARAGLPATATAGYESAAELARSLGDPAVRAYALVGLGRTHLHAGRQGQASLSLRDALAEAKAAHDADAEGAVLLGLAAVEHESGRPGEAALLLERARALARRCRLVQLFAAIEHLRGNVEHAKGRPAAALAAQRRALALLRTRGEPEMAWRVLAEIASLLAARPRSAAAATGYRRRARAVIRRVAASVHDPQLRRAYLADKDRAALLGRDGVVAGEDADSRGSGVTLSGPRETPPDARVTF